MLLAAIQLISCLHPAHSRAAQTGGPAPRLVEEFRLDGKAHDWSRINSLAVSTRGRLALAQGNDTKVLVYSPTGELLYSFGSKGEGPGDFRQLNTVGWLGDTLWAIDRGLFRVTWIGPDGKLLRTQGDLGPSPQSSADKVLSGLGLPMLATVNPSHLVLATTMTRGSASDSPGRLPAAASQAVAVRLPQAGTPARVVASLPPDPCMVWYPIQGGRGASHIPLCQSPMMEVSTVSDRIAVVTTTNPVQPYSSFRLTVVRSTGDTAFARDVSFKPVPTPKDSSERALFTPSRVARLGANATAAQSAVRRAGFPKQFPEVLRALLAEEGETWLELWSATQDRHWRIFGARGEDRGEFSVPRNSSLVAVARGTVWAIETDDDGIESLVRYRITR